MDLGVSLLNRVEVVLYSFSQFAQYYVGLILAAFLGITTSFQFPE